MGMGGLLATAAEAQTFLELCCPGLYSLPEEGSTDALRLRNLRCPNLYRCAWKVLARERESHAHVYPSATAGEAPMFLHLRCSGLVQIGLSMVQTEALPVLKLRRPGL